MAEKKEGVQPWTSQDNSNYLSLKSRYGDRNALGDEAISKKKALKETAADSPLYQRAVVAAEMAALRWDMSYIVAENEKMREHCSTISWLHEQLSIVQGAYAHTKMLAERARIDYSLTDTTLKIITKLKEELENGVKQGRDKADGAKS